MLIVRCDILGGGVNALGGRPLYQFQSANPVFIKIYCDFFGNRILT